MKTMDNWNTTVAFNRTIQTENLRKTNSEKLWCFGQIKQHIGLFQCQIKINQDI